MKQFFCGACDQLFPVVYCAHGHALRLEPQPQMPSPSEEVADLRRQVAMLEEREAIRQAEVARVARKYSDISWENTRLRSTVSSARGKITRYRNLWRKAKEDKPAHPYFQWTAQAAI